jgi:hypothetical protein
MFLPFAGFVSYEKPTCRFSGDERLLKNVPWRWIESDPFAAGCAGSSSSAL